MRYPASRSPIWPEYLFAAFTAAFGVSLLFPNNAFALSVNYAVLARIAGEVEWGVAFVAYAFVWMVGIATHSLKWRRILGIFGAFLLLWLSISIIVSNPLSTSGPPFGAVACGAAYCAARLVIPWTPH